MHRGFFQPVISFFLSIAALVALLFGAAGHTQAPPTTQPAAVAASVPSTPATQVSPTATTTTSASAVSVNSLAAQPSSLAISNTEPHSAPTAVTTPAPSILSVAQSSNYITQDELTTQLQIAESNMRSLLYQNVSAPNSTFATGGYTNEIAASNKIDQLSGTKLTNVTVNGITGLTASNIPDLSATYLTRAGGANDIDVFLIAGQSNAQGYEYGVVAAASTSPTITPGTAYQYYNGAISPANDPVGNAFYGSAWPQFAISYYAKTGHKVAFVPAAVPGTALDPNDPSNGSASNWSPAGTLFGTSVSQINAAMAAFSTAGYAPHFVGVLWDQGENDADGINSGSGVTGSAYQNDLQTLITNYRTQLGSNTPFYIFRTGRAGSADSAGYITIRNAQEAAASSTPNTFIVFRNAVDFWARGLMNGSYHYSQAGYNEMGRIGAETIANRSTAPQWEGQSNNLIFDTSQGGLVLIGTSTPTTDWSTSTLTLNDKSTSTYSVAMNIGNTSSTTWSNLQFSNDSAPQGGWIGMFGSNFTSTYDQNRFIVAGWATGLNLFGNSDIRFLTAGFTSSGYERMRITGTGVGIGTTSPSTLLELGGSTANLTMDGYKNCTGFTSNANGLVACTASDQRLKQNITQLDASSTLAALNALNPVSFFWKPDTQRGGQQQYGLIAQEVQQIFPNLVSTSSPTALTPDGTLTVNYDGLIAPLIIAVQQLSKEVSGLIATVAGFAQSFTSNKVTTKELCVEKSDGSTVCASGDQLAAFLTGQTTSQPQVQISGPTTPVISGTTTPPTINIQGNNPATINVGDTYVDLGAIVTDNQGHDLSYKTYLHGTLVNTLTIDTSAVATDTIDYVATDTWGNTSTSTRTVVVEAASGN